ncbi:hypothetical protein [Oricola sp.]|uniref:hypothetical protein n=1 Tax=Oricola sp. TaxID=1979950 RepID=UPI003BA878DB
MRAGLTLAALALAGAMLAGCGERVEWHQKLTVEVETPDGIVTGTGVVQIRMRWLEDWQRFASANRWVPMCAAKPLSLRLRPDATFSRS